MSTKEQSTKGDQARTDDVVDGEELAVSLGQALRDRRKSRGLTLQKLADVCGLSQPFLSQLENGKAMPSLMALHQVAAALGTSAQDLLQPSVSTEISLVRGDTTRCYELDELTSACFLVEGTGHQLETNLITAKRGASAGHPFAHQGEGEEMIYVLEGSISVTLSDHEPVELNTGDAYTYPVSLPHEWINVGEGRARFLFVTTPPSF
jgi:transcriptional regulator with XRE-family HTH domain